MNWDDFIGKVEEEATIIRMLAESDHEPQGYRLGEVKAHAISLLSLCEVARKPRLREVPRG